MRLLGIIKRAVPFIGTFAIGLFIASFFVTLALPKVEVKASRSWKSSHSRSYCRVKRENRRLRRKIRRLERRKARKVLKMRTRRIEVFEVPAPPPPVLIERKR